MKKVTFALALSVLAALTASAAPLTLYISAVGNDAWSGTLAAPAENDGPFATPARAIAALREAAAAGPLTEGAAVYVREGTYYLNEPLRFDGALTGSESGSIRFQAYPNEKPRLVGGLRIENPEPVEGSIVRYNLSALALPPGRVAEVYAGGGRQVPSRWPNLGEGDLPGGGFTFVQAAVEDARDTAFIYTGDRPGGWTKPEAIEVSLWPNYNWSQSITALKSVHAETRRVTLAAKQPYTIEPGRRFFFQHVREELDAPGEWYHDVEKQELLLWPSSDGEVVVPVVDSLIMLDGVSYVHIAGFDMHASRSDAINVKNATNCILAKNTIHDVFGRGITVDGGEDVRILGNDIYETGSGGVRIGGGDRNTLQPGRHLVKNNHIHHFARIMKTYHTGVQIDGVGNTVANNLIHDAPHIAILLTGNEHIIEFNEIHHVCMESGDNGAFYMGRDWTQRGIIIRNNIFHDVYGFGLANPSATDGIYHYETPHQAWGVYLDDATSGVKVTGNLFYRVPLCGVMIGGGRDNEVTNNFFYNSIPALHIDDRWETFPWEGMQRRMEEMNYTQPPYSERYPELLQMGTEPRRPPSNNKFNHNIIKYTRDDFRGLTSTAPNPESAAIYNFDQFDPETTTVDYNLIDSGGQPVRIAWSVYKQDNSFELLSFEQWREKGFDPNSAIDGAKFVDAENADFRFQGLEKEVPAVQMGINPLPLHRVGLYQDEFRASWPPPKDERRDGMEHKRITIDLNPPAPDAGEQAAPATEEAPADAEQATPATDEAPADAEQDAATSE